MPEYIIYYAQGNSNGPFDIYLSGSSGLNLYESNVQKYQLINGYQVVFPDGIPSSSVDIFDVAYGCFTDQNVPFPSQSPSVTPSLSITPTRTPSLTVSPTVTPSITRTPSVTPSITPPPSTTPSVTPSVTVSRTPNISPSVSRTPSPSPPFYAFLWMGTCSSTYTAGYIACSSFNTCAGFYTRVNNLAVGVVFYIDANCTIPKPSLAGNWAALSLEGTGPITAVQLNSLGQVQSFYYC